MPSKKQQDIITLNDVDKLIHEPARLNIMTLLYVIDSADFLFIMRQTNLTFGNLSAHLKKLEDAHYIEIIKKFIGKKPHTMIKLTSEGKKAYETYREQMTKFFQRS
jgi:DNA-binding MarR family transcriptional regulator